MISISAQDLRTMTQDDVRRAFGMNPDDYLPVVIGELDATDSLLDDMEESE